MARTGRPRGFSREHAVEHAMLLFWQHGFEATSLARLRDALGLSAASFYAAFGSKEGLFRAVLARYLETHGQVMAPLHDPDLAPREAIERMLRGTLAMQTDPAHPPGCLVVLSSMGWGAGNDELRAVLGAERERNRAAIRACIDRAVARSDLPAGTDAASLASVLDAILMGLSIEARDHVPRITLGGAVDRAMALWDATARTGQAAEKGG